MEAEPGGEHTPPLSAPEPLQPALLLGQDRMSIRGRSRPHLEAVRSDTASEGIDGTHQHTKASMHLRGVRSRELK